MEIKKRTLVAIISGSLAQCNPIGVVMELEEKRGPKRFLVKSQKETNLSVRRDHIFALAENCNPDANITNEFNKKLPEIIRNFATILCDQQKQIKEHFMSRHAG